LLHCGAVHGEADAEAWCDDDGDASSSRAAALDWAEES